MKDVIRNKVQRSKRVTIKSLKCYTSSEANGDEVYLKINDNKIWPSQSFERVHSSEELPINLQIPVEEEQGFVRIDLWESDLIQDDHLGFFLFKVDAVGEFGTDLTSNRENEGHRYSLVWST